MSIIAKLDALQPPPPKSQKPTHHVLTLEEGLAIIRARRRGVGVRTIERETGLRYGAIYSKLGAWAMRYAALPDCESPAEECSAPHRHTVTLEPQ